MHIERKNYPFMLPPVGPYVHSVKHNSTLYLSGITAFGSESQSAEIELQAKEIFNQIQKIAQAENSGLENIIKITSFVTDLTRMNEMRNVLFEFCGENFPASSLIHVDGLFSEDLKIEIEAIIALPS